MSNADVFSEWCSPIECVLGYDYVLTRNIGIYTSTLALHVVDLKLRVPS